ncbi:MAG: hypothetical protein Q9196_006629 [Gyalolechia fulgens]
MTITRGTETTVSGSARNLAQKTVTPLKGKTDPQTSPEKPEPQERPTFQWFWAGTHGETKTLTPDLKYTVKRHVVAKRVLPIDQFPEKKAKDDKVKPPSEPSALHYEDRGEYSGSVVEGDDNDDVLVVEGDGNDDDLLADYVKPLSEDEIKKKGFQDRNEDLEHRNENLEEKMGDRRPLDRLLEFNFGIQVRVKKRYGRLHRVLLLSGNEVKGKILKPPFAQQFRLHAEPVEDGIPDHDTPDINAELNRIKAEYDGDWDDLQDKDFFEMSSAYVVERVCILTKMGLEE